MNKLVNKQDNLLENNELSMFRELDVKYTVSSRAWQNDMRFADYVKKFFPYIELKQVESLFGFADETSSLYGGRGVSRETLLSRENIQEIYNSGVGLSLTLTNHFFAEESYQSTYSLLLKHHKTGNSVVCNNDTLAQRIRQDFPLYKIKASLIKNLNSYEKVVAALATYDHVVIPMEMNDNDDFLSSLPEKERITLFGNANCAYNCKARTCYKHISKKIIGRKVPENICSQNISPREKLGHLFFDIRKLRGLGFTLFKLVPNPQIQHRERMEKVFAEIIENYKG